MTPNYLRVLRPFALDRVRGAEGPGPLGFSVFLLDLPLLFGAVDGSSILAFLGDGGSVATPSAELSAASSLTRFFPLEGSFGFFKELANFPLLVLGCSPLSLHVLAPNGTSARPGSSSIRI
jgi:hypothetical protein